MPSFYDGFQTVLEYRCVIFGEISTTLWSEWTYSYFVYEGQWLLNLCSWLYRLCYLIKLLILHILIKCFQYILKTVDHLPFSHIKFPLYYEWMSNSIPNTKIWNNNSSWPYEFKFRDQTFNCILINIDSPCDISLRDLFLFFPQFPVEKLQSYYKKISQYVVYHVKYHYLPDISIKIKLCFLRKTGYVVYRSNW